MTIVHKLIADDFSTTLFYTFSKPEIFSYLQLAIRLHFLGLVHCNLEGFTLEVISTPQHAHDAAEVFLLI